MSERFVTLRNLQVKVNWERILPITGEVIIVEDDSTLRSLMIDIIGEIGGNALAFENADKALAHLLKAHEECSLVIADHGVPGRIQGAEFIEMVKSRWPEIPAILTSGYEIAPEQVPKSAIYLHKPWSLDDLAIAVASLLQPDFSVVCAYSEP